MMLNQIEKSSIFLLVLEFEHMLGYPTEMSMQCRDVPIDKYMYVGSSGTVKLGSQAPLLILPTKEKTLGCQFDSLILIRAPIHLYGIEFR